MNPYKVLGISEDADTETIKKAYRDLVKKYHPDRYVNNPLSDLASEKLKEINAAYDMLTKNPTQSNSYSNSSSSSYNNSNSYSNSSYYTPSYQGARMLIQQRKFNEAEKMLSGLPQNAEWNYLMGLICINRGFYDRGITYIQRAVNMEPNNMEYSSTLNSMHNRNSSYRNVYTGSSRKSTCDCCCNLLMLDCCCECMGGDLIPCC